MREQPSERTSQNPTPFKTKDEEPGKQQKPAGCAAGSPSYYVAFFCSARNFAHRARAAPAILFLPAADMVRLAGADAVLATNFGPDCFRTLAHRAFCAKLILLRADADRVRFGWALPDAPVPFNDSIPEIIWSNLSISICAWLRFLRSSLSALSKFDIC